MKRYFIGDYIFDVEVLDVWNFENEEYEHIETIALEETGEVDFPSDGVDPSNEIYCFAEVTAEIKKLESEIENTIERNIMSSGKMCTETVTSKITLTDEEIKLFKAIDTFDTKNYWWEIEENTLIIDYTEEV